MSKQQGDPSPGLDVGGGGAAALRPARPLDALKAIRLPHDSIGLRLFVGALAVLAAYHYSLLTLVRNLGLDTPLSYLGLVPLIAIGIALLLPRTSKAGPDIHDRQLDYILGVPLVAGTVAAIQVLPERLSALFWTTRLDLLTLPVFVLGVSILLFGLRPTWRFRVPIAFLLLAWPYPYTQLIDKTLALTTDTTIAGVKAALRFVAVAVPLPSGDGSLFQVPYGGASGPFQVSIASACAGVNSLVGFIIVGTAFLAVVRSKPRRDGSPGGRGLLRKAAWLGVGLVLVWALNVFRLVLVLGVGKLWGEKVAIDGLHPVIGMFTFSTAVLVILVAMPLFGLRVVTGERKPRIVGEKTTKRWARNLAVRHDAARGVRFSAIAVVAAALVLGGTNSSFKHFELVAGDLGSPRLAGFAEKPAQVPAYSVGQIDKYDWVRQFFGAESSWNRFQYSPTTYTAGASSSPIIADVIDGKSLTPFNAYGIAACYKFHGYDTTPEQRINLDGGITGYSISFRDPRQTVTWNVVYWVWPVQTAAGKRYERVVLLQQNGSAADYAAAQPDSSPLQRVGASAPLGSAAGPAAQQVRERNQAGLVTFAKQVVANQSAAARAPTGADSVRPGSGNAGTTGTTAGVVGGSSGSTS